MSKIVDVLVVGSGMAGLMAALAAACQGKSVRLLYAGTGSLAISGGTIDLLGYVDEIAVIDPWEGMARLPENHPYRLMGMDAVRTAMDFLKEHLQKQGYHMRAAVRDGQECNTWLPTIMGTLRPTWLLPATIDHQALQTAHRVLVCSVEKLRDCRPSLVIDQLQHYASWKEREYNQALLPSPFGDTHRSVSALDLARLADREQNSTWLPEALSRFAGTCDIILIPPLCGCRADTDLQRAACAAAQCPVVEMASIPPGVGGLRLRDALQQALRRHDVSRVENAKVLQAETEGDMCTALMVSASGDICRHTARAFVLATGGILGGGVKLQPGVARESVFGVDIPVPKDISQWSEREIFGKHLFSHLGVRVDSAMRPLDATDKPHWRNVFFAGRTLAGYDYAAEKCGLGVAAATGWQAGRMAAQIAGDGKGM